jgi:hypothetical protein
MSDESQKPPGELKKLADELIESINEDPEMEPGQADTRDSSKVTNPKSPSS